MIKNIKIRLFFLLVASFGSCYSSQEDESDKKPKYELGKIVNQAAPFGAGALALACKLSPYAAFMATVAAATHQSPNPILKDENSPLVEKNYPFCSDWKKGLVDKYPDANFEKIQFRKGFFLDSKFSWFAYQSFSYPSQGKIYCPSNALETINSAYEKKSKGVRLTDEENLMIKQATFCVLHEAGHLKNNDSINTKAVLGGTLLALESSYQLWKKKSRSFVAPSLPRRFIAGTCLFASMSVVSSLSLACDLRYRETRADQFAIERADEELLKAGKKFFEDGRMLFEDRGKEKLGIGGQMSILLSTHHPYVDRIKAIDDELERRAKGK